MKKYFVIFGIMTMLCMCLFAINTSAVSDTVTAYGNCGKNITWILYDDGEMVVSGTGEITDWTTAASSSGARITKVTIKPGVTAIGDKAFMGWQYLASINIPNTVGYIGENAFRGCPKLAEVNMTEGLISIGNSAFYGCTKLESIQIPDSVTDIGVAAFSSCSALKSISISKNVISIGNSTFYSCKSLTGITVDADNPNYSSDERGVLFDKNKTKVIQYPIGNAADEYNVPDGVLSIGRNAFHSCTNLKRVYIPDGVTEIGIGAFYSCDYLTDVRLPESVSNIGKSAFYLCRYLTQITIPDRVENIGEYAFSRCALTSLDIPDSVIYIGENCFSANTSLTDVNIGSGVVSIGANAFFACEALKNVNITDIDRWYEIDFGDEAANPFYYAKRLCLNGEELTDWTIPEGVNRIGSYMFYGREDLLNVTIPNGVESIGDYAFSECTNLISVDIPPSVKRIGGGAFDNYSELARVNITDIRAWYELDLGYNWLYKDILYLNGELVAECKIPEGTRHIGSFIISVYNPESIVIPDSVTSIGKSAFSRCQALTSVVIPNGVESIGNSAFYSCSNLSSVVIPGSVQSIGNGAFEYCTALKNIQIPHGVTSIGDYAFRATWMGDNLIIPASVTSIGDYAFYGVASFPTKVIIYSSTVTLGENIFRASGSELEIHAYKGSTAEAYASENRHKFVAIPEFTGITEAILSTMSAPASATVTPLSGGFIEGENTFTVACDKPCRVFVTSDGGVTYERLTATANANGGYDFTANLTAESEIIVRLAGDINGNGSIAANDYTRARNIFLDSSYATDAINRAMLDNNGDGCITVNEITLIKRILLGYNVAW